MDIKCVNWFDSKGENRYLYLKAINKDSEVIFVRFDYYYYYVYDEDFCLDYEPVETYKLGKFTVIPIDEIPVTSSDDVCLKKTQDVKLILVKDSKKNRKKQYFDEYLDITWFYLINNILPDGCYKINIHTLTQINKDCYHCDNARNLFVQNIPTFHVKYTYLLFDIECQFDKKFPSVFTNPVSHISCWIIDKIREYKFTLINVDLLDTRPEAICDTNEFSPEKDITYCSEIVLLKIIKKILEHRFDFIITFNGNNFDIRYIANRLEILEKDYIYFSLPDKTDTVKLKVYERVQNGGVFSNKTYHVNNNNGVIFFDLYTFIQKVERLDSYKLDNISKNIFKCSAFITEVHNELISIKPIQSDKNISMFINVLKTGNYITIDDDDVAEIVHKDISNNDFTVKVISKKKYNEDSVHVISFGKDSVDLQYMYKHYNLETAIKIKDYCIHDACLCKHIWDYYNITSKINAASSSYLLPQSLALEYRASTLIKGPLLKLLLQEKVLFKRFEQKVKYPYEGGKVFYPLQKIFENNVMVFDYNSLYPNVCIHANLSPEKLVCVVLNGNKLEYEIHINELKKKYSYPDYIITTCEPRSEEYYNEIIVYDRREEGIIPKLLNFFMEKRKYYKQLLKQCNNVIEYNSYDSLQYIYKIIANSVYGLMGFSSSTLYSYSSAKCCTTLGRNMITYLDSVISGSVWNKDTLVLSNYPKNIFSEVVISPKEFKVPNLQEVFTIKNVYGDTDSIFSELSTKNIENTFVVARELERIINTNVLYSNFKVTFESVYTQLIIQSKKKYTTLKYDSDYKPGDAPKRINKGTSETRRDVALYHKQMIQKYKNLLMAYLNGNGKIDITDRILKQLEADMVFEFSYNTDVNKYVLSRKHHNNYKSMTHVNFELVKKYNLENLEKIEIGERYYYIYICEKNTPWQRKLSNIKSYEVIVDNKFTLPPDKRIFYEVYFRRISSEVVNLLTDKTLCTIFFTRLFGIKPVFTSY